MGETTDAELRQRQSLPLEAKIVHTQQVIRQWHEHWDGDVYVSFSGGKDSTVLLSLVRELYPEVPAVYIDTGLEWPEVKEFARHAPNLVVIRPDKSFREVLDEYGYPVVSKEVSQYIREARTTKSKVLRNKRIRGDEKGSGRIPLKWQYLMGAPFKISDQCCKVMKKAPAHRYEKETGRKPFIGVMASDSRQRMQQYLRNGCNAFEVDRPISKPLSIWTENDIWEYIRTRNIPYASIYDKGWDRTGCVFCGFGCHLDEGKNRFQRMQETHPQLHHYCMKNLGMDEVLDWVGIQPYAQPSLFDIETA